MPSWWTWHMACTTVLPDYRAPQISSKSTPLLPLLGLNHLPMCGVGDAPNLNNKGDSSSWYFAAICRNASDETTDPYKVQTNYSPTNVNADCGDDEEIVAWIPSPPNELLHGKIDFENPIDNAHDSVFEKLILHSRPSSNPLLSKSLKIQKRPSRKELHFAPYQHTRSSSVDHLADKMKRWNMRKIPPQQPQQITETKTDIESWKEYLPSHQL